MDELRFYLKKIHNQLDSSFSRALQDYGLTCTQSDLLIYLAKDPKQQYTLTNIAAHFGVRHTSMIHVLKLLEKKGFIYRSDCADARVKAIALTDHGRQVTAEIGKRGSLLNGIMFAHFSEDELYLLEKMLKQIYENLQSDEFQKF